MKLVLSFPSKKEQESHRSYVTFLRPHGRWLDLHSSEMKLLSHVGLLVIPWTVAYQAPPSMGFSRQEYWSGVPLPSPKERLAPLNFNSKMFGEGLELAMLGSADHPKTNHFGRG